MDKYKKLAGNTVIFAIGSFSSKLLVFLLMPFYTWVLPPGDYGEADLITQSANLIAPIAMLAVSEAITRFVIDHSLERRAVFTAGLLTTLGGAGILLCCLPLLGMIDTLSAHIWLIFLFVLSNNLRGLCASFCRGSGYVRLYAFDGVLTTFATVMFNVLFLAVIEMGGAGLVAGTVAANCLSVVFLFCAAKLHRFIRFRGLKREVFGSLYRYCVPLIPTTLFWWINNVSDRYVIEYFCGREMTGLYAVACKIPNLLTVASTIFYQAWLLSAVGEFGDAGRGRFYSRVTQTYMSLVFLAGSGLMLLTRLLLGLLVAGNAEYLSAYEYVPFLLLSEVFSTFATFLGAFYAAAKNNTMVPVTIFIGAAANIGLNIWLVPLYGPVGAAFATFISCLMIFLVRIVDVRRFVRLRMGAPVVILSSILMIFQCRLVYMPTVWGYLGQAGIILLLLVINRRPLLFALREALRRI